VRGKNTKAVKNKTGIELKSKYQAKVSRGKKEKRREMN